MDKGSYSPSSCSGNCCTGTGSFTTTASAVADGTLLVRIDASSAVNYGPCMPLVYEATVSYNSNTPPVLSSIANQSTPEDTSDSVGFTVSDAQDSNGSIAVSATSSNTSVINNVSATNSSGNGTVSWTPVTNAYGTSTITVTATDSSGATDTESFVVTVNSVNDAPVAHAGSNLTGQEGTPVGMNGSGSSDVDDGIVQWAWDCDANGSYETTATSATAASCTYPDNGTWTVGLRVTDAGGLTDTDSLLVTISNLPPALISSTYGTGNEGSPLSFGVTWSDPGSADTHVVSWDFGDSGTGTGASVTHTYADDGTYTVTVTIYDDDGGSVTDTSSTVVNNVAPTFTSITAPDGTEGLPISFAASATDPGADTITFTWDWGDASSTSTGASLTHTYTDDGTYTVTITASDEDGGSTVTSETIVIGNADPVITSVNIPSAGTEGSSVSMSAAATDVSGDPLTYSWNFGDSGTGTGGSVSHTWAEDGTYTVTLTVHDGDGGSDTVSQTIAIANAAPVISAANFGSGVEGDAIPFSVAFADAGALDTHTVAWDFGDASSGSGASPTHVYADDGTYTVTVTVYDDDGGSDSATGTSVAVNAAPVISSSSIPDGDEGEVITFSVSYSDAGAGDTHTISWNFGDSGVATGAAVTHTYADNGAYAVTVTVTDDDGGTDSTGGTSTIANVDPVIVSIAGPVTGAEQEALTWTVTATDAGAADTHTCSFDFGDGSPAVTGLDTDVTHAYDDDGVYTLTVTVYDDDGGSVTDTLTITIENGPPVLQTMSVPASADEGAAVAMSAFATDSPSDTLLYEWDFGDSGTATGDSVTHTWADDGVYTVTVTVYDDDGGSDALTATITVNNVAPSIDSLTVNNGNEGELLVLGATASDPGADTLTFTWDFGDSSAGLGETPNHTWADDGTYTVTLTVYDDEGGSDTSSTPITILNVDPTIDELLAGSGDEGETLTYWATGLDMGDDTLSYEWDFGDGSPAAAGMAQTHVYEDDGAYTVTLVISDEDGGSVTGTATSTVANVDPELTSLTGPASGDEGSDLTFEASATDLGVADIPDLALLWDFGDSETGADTPVDHAFDDEGTYTVTVTVSDGDGGTATDTLSVDIANVAPDITSSAPAFASEAVLWSYQAVAVDPGDDVLTWSLSESAPDGMTLDVATGLLEWTPTYDQSLGGPYSATLTVDDGDGGTDVEVFTVVVGWADDDGDGMADEWELDNGLDPTDPSDAASDADLDGVPALDEFLDGTDPNSFDGPTAPVLVAPIEGDEVLSSTPDLVVENASDPQLDVLVYDFEVYEDEAMTVLVTAAGDAVPETDTETSWKVDLPLVENAEYHWRASASDGHVWGPWTDLESFVVNEFNEPPPAPVPLYPVLGETVASLDVELSWTGLDDPDGDALTFDLVLWDELMETVITEAVDLSMPEARDLAGAWLVDVGLDEDVWYVWEVRAVDEHGLAGDWSTPEDFFHDTSNAAPAGVWFVDPLDGDVVGTVSPVLVATEAIDPEGQELTYRFEVDTVPTFDSVELVAADVPETLLGEVAWDLLDDGVELPEDVTVHARVRAVDPGGVGSEWDVISFFVAGDNGAPGVPELLVPEDGTELEATTPSLVVSNVTDPEGDLVFYDFLVARDLELTDVVTAQAGVLEGSGDDGDELYTSWRVDVELDGELFWSARAVDELGAASEWAAASSFTVGGGELPPTDDDGITTGGASCDCESSVVGASGGGPAVLLLGLLALGIRRRRQRSP